MIVVEIASRRRLSGVARLGKAAFCNDRDCETSIIEFDGAIRAGAAQSEAGQKQEQDRERQRRARPSPFRCPIRPHERVLVPVFEPGSPFERFDSRSKLSWR